MSVSYLPVYSIEKKLSLTYFHIAALVLHGFIKSFH
jgi:hypothetical protein